MTEPDILSPDALGDIKARHEACVKVPAGPSWYGEAAHKDRAALLAHIAVLSRPTAGAHVSEDVLRGILAEEFEKIFPLKTATPGAIRAEQISSMFDIPYRVVMAAMRRAAALNGGG